MDQQQLKRGFLIIIKPDNPRRIIYVTSGLITFVIILLLLWTVFPHIQALPGHVSMDNRQVSSVSELVRLFEDYGYDWPPEKVVPRLAINSFPAGMKELEVRQKKALFFQSLLPIVASENLRTRIQREFIVRYFRADIIGVDARVADNIDALATLYNINGNLATNEAREALLMRVDELPVELILAQAAKESGWGTSRFAREANNLFGEWTYQKHAGIKPKKRDEGERHLIRKFPDIRDSVRSYLHNINTGHAYEELRQIRAKLRSLDEPLDPLALATGLKYYSERGEDYVKEILEIISLNKLERFSGIGLANKD